MSNPFPKCDRCQCVDWEHVGTKSVSGDTVDTYECRHSISADEQCGRQMAWGYAKPEDALGYDEHGKARGCDPDPDGAIEGGSLL